MLPASGPSAFEPAFGVPTVLTDHLEVTGVWRPHDYIVTRTFFDGDKLYRQESAADAGFLDGYVRWFKDRVPGVGYHFNTAAELIDATNEMYQSTAACIGWRGPMEGSVRSPRPNAFMSPTPKSDRRDLLIPPSRRRST